jgi:poly-gamma-glutamate synthesis protein (capsule biosynthesis protein)
VAALTSAVPVLTSSSSRPTTTRQAHAETSRPDQLSITFVGDTLLGDAAQPLLSERGYLWPFEHLVPLLGADFVIANAEGPFTTSTTPHDPNATYSYNAEPEAIAGLAEAGVDAISMANNHAMDRGPDGVTSTQELALANGMVTVGAGADLDQAREALVLHTPVGSVGFVAMAADLQQTRRAGPERAGAAPLTRTTLERGYEQARASGADWVVALVHWGENYTDLLDDQRSWAQILVDTGYDLIVGSGPHVVQPIELVGGTPVAYSIGNGVFGTPGRFTTEHPGYGLLLTVEVSRSGPVRLRADCIATDNRRVEFQPRPCAAAEAALLLASVHPDLVRPGHVGELELQRGTEQQPS